MTTLRLSAMPPGSAPGEPADARFDLDASPGDLHFQLLSGNGDTATRLGAIRLAMHVGQTVPRYWYYVGKVAYRSDEPVLARNDRVLLLGNDFTGAHELRGLWLGDPADPTHLDALLAGALALTPPGDAPTGQPVPVILEVPGPGRAEHAPFWIGTGSHFYPRPFPELRGDARLAWESQLASLLPRQPLVVSLLGTETQAAIGACAEDATSLRDAALRCGFRQSQQVRICDGGPVFEATTAFFRFAAGRSLETLASLPDSRRCVIRTDDRLDAWIVNAGRVAGGITLASTDGGVQDALRGRAWDYAFY